jgi:HEAT repeat protein
LAGRSRKIRPSVAELRRNEDVDGLVRLSMDPEQSRDVRVREDVATALYQLGGWKARDALRVLARDSARSVRAIAVAGLAQASDPVEIPVLLSALCDEDANVRLHAVRGLAGFSDQTSADALIDVLGDKDSSVRVAAAKALARRGQPDAVEPIAALYARSRFPSKVPVGRALAELRAALELPPDS